MLARARRDPEFREGLLNEGIGALLGGEVDVGKALLRDYINAAIGFDELGRLTDKSPKSLMRMFGPNGNPQACAICSRSSTRSSGIEGRSASR